MSYDFFLRDTHEIWWRSLALDQRLDDPDEYPGVWLFGQDAE